MKNDVWFVPLGTDTALIYAPFHGISTLVNRAMADTVAVCLFDRGKEIPEGMEWIGRLREPGNAPERRIGDPEPLFLGLIPTRGCMMRCAYCDFVSPQLDPPMSFEMIRQAIDGYAKILRGKTDALWNMHFFGGEPFAAFKEVVFAVNYAHQKASELGIPTHFEVTTNGFYPVENCRWIAENIDTVVLSLDGFPEVQNRHRPGPQRKASFPVVCRSADIFSHGSCELIIRSCVSSENVEQLPDWSAYLADRWAVEAVCLEPMIESPLARKNGLIPPEPDNYVNRWTEAYRILKAARIRQVCSSGDVSTVRNSLCPMGRDALIVSADGSVGSCWQLAENQQSGDADLRFGSVLQEGIHIDRERLENQRARSEENRERCRGCFCYAHCAGGCMLNRDSRGDFCRITRMLTLWQILEQLGYTGFADDLLADPAFRDFLTGRENFLPEQLSFPQGISISVGMQGCGTVPNGSPDPVNIPDPVFREDAQTGWLRDGDRILIGDPSKNTLEILTGDAALRFQLEHSGMKPSEIKEVRKALKGEVF